MDAVVLADSPLARVRIAGLEARERAVRVAKRVGAERVLVIERAEDRASITTWRTGSAPLLVIRADQLVHTPLVAPLVEAGREGLAIAVGPDDAYAGALHATGAAAQAIVRGLAQGTSDSELAAAADIRVPHGAIARHAIDTPAAKRAAHRLLYKILVKPQDNAITRYLYRPVSLPLTRLLVWTPITPNQVSYLIAIVVAIGCWFTAQASIASAAIGTIIVLAASYLDCCDGEIARVKLTSSKYGAWIDTVIDEVSSIAYIAALGWHCYQHYGPDYLGFDVWSPDIVLGIATNIWSMYCVYYNIIVGVGSANSQDYAGRFDVVPGDGNTVHLRPIAQAIAPAADRPAWLTWLATYMPYIVRRDFLSWMAVVLAVVGATQLLFAILTLGAWIMVVILTVDHIWLRRLRHSLAREGKVLIRSA